MESAPETPSETPRAESPAVPVVASVVVASPSSDLAEAVGALAAQDYPQVQHVFFVAGDAAEGGVDEATAVIRAALPGAIVRNVVGNPGYGPTQNELARMVEGDNGLFLFLHDDVALAPDAISQMVAELFRSNAGLVGPKLVDWDDPTILQHVGLGADRTGEIDPIVLAGERDQEQHDGVGDVFCVPSACMLVRADLFRGAGGFSPDIDFGGEELDLCWRIHLTGGRVLVVPSAVARHREGFASRNPDIDLNERRERHRVDTVLAATSASRFVPVVMLIIGLSLVEMFAGVVSGRSRRAITALGATLGALLHPARLLARRKRFQSIRVVSDAEVHDLQVQGSARLVAYLRRRRVRADVRRLENRLSAGERERRSRAVWGLIGFLVVVLGIGSRRIITSGVTFVGQFVPFTESWRSLGAAYRLGWWPSGFGAASPAPTGTALVAVATFFSFGNPAMVRTIGVLGLVVFGLAGMWRFGAEVARSPRARAAGVVVYASLPLPYECIATGRWGALACYAAAPWCFLAFSRANDMLTATAADVGRRAIRLGLLLGAVAAFEPSFLVVVAVGAAVYMFISAICQGIRSLHGLPGVVMASLVVAVLLNFPWVGHYVSRDWWQFLVGADTGIGRHAGVLRVLTFDLGRSAFAPAVAVLYGVLVVAVLVARDARFVWAARAAGICGVAAIFAITSDAHGFGFKLPEVSVISSFLAMGLAIGAMVVLEAFDFDVKGERFGWRQPLVALAGLALLIPVFPLIVNSSGGRWNQPTSSTATLLEQLSKDPDQGDYRVLYLGSADLLPAAPRVIRVANRHSDDSGNLAYAVTDDGIATVSSQWAPSVTSAVKTLENALVHLVDGDTPRVGRLLAPLGVRYVVVPRIDGARSTRNAPLNLPTGLLDALRVQLDLRRQYESADLMIYENVAWVPTVAQLSKSGADASTSAGMDALVLTDLRGATPAKSGFVAGRATQRLTVSPGVVSVAVPPSERWTLSVDGRRLRSRPAFGAVTGFDIPEGVNPESRATLRFDRPFLQVAFVLIQFSLWAIAVFVSSGLRLRRRRALPVVVGAADTRISFAGDPT